MPEVTGFSRYITFLSVLSTLTRQISGLSIGISETDTLVEAVHPPGVVIVTVYSMLFVTNAFGFDMVESFKPFVGDQVYSAS